MAAQAAVSFEQNTYSPGMRRAIQYARKRGQVNDIFSSRFVCDLHQKITGHNLRNSYRSCDVRFGPFDFDNVVHHSKIAVQMLALAGDVQWLLASSLDTWTVVARVVSRLVTMQPFTDGNKRTAFAAAHYVMAYRKMDGYLMPRMQDCEQFLNHIYHGDERRLISLLQSWHKKGL